MNIKKAYSERNRKKILPIQATCRNCGAGLHGRYCHACGQDLFQSTKRTVGSMAFHSMENVISIDSQLFITMKYLLFRPGKLTKEYINGRIVRYVHPSKLFWFISILFFMLLTMNISNKINVGPEKANTVVKKERTIPPESSKAASSAKASEDSDNTITETINNKKNKDKEQILREKQFKSDFLGYAPYVSFLLIPFFALLLNIFFRKKELFYADHLTFALHFHAFMFLLFSAYILIYKLYPSYDYEVYFFLVIPLIYFIWALWVVYRPRKWSLLFKTLAIMFTYGIAIFISLICLIVATAILNENQDEAGKVIGESVQKIFH